MSDATLSRTSMIGTRTGPSARKALTAAAVLVFALWTLAAVATLIYWSGLVLSIAGALALGGFVWILTVYLRPNGAPEET